MTNASPSLPAERPLEPQRRAIVVGASSGIGAALVRELAHRGYIVAAVARREQLLAELCAAVNAAAGATRACAYTHNVTAYDETADLFQRIVGELGGLDLIVYVAGVQPAIALDEYNFDKDRQVVEVNVLGAMAWLNEAALRFSRAGAGHIVGISSIAGDRGRVGFPAYAASKAAFTTYLEALRNRLSRRGVTVTTIKPGMVQTPMLEAVDRTMWPISPAAAAADIYDAIARGQQTRYVPRRWRWVALVIQHIPSVIFRRLSF